ncbi:membrane protein [Candidatus Omnitrophus magneticus]|uniref:Membrane protein n=1 Tax=Candidatus Omnitrophus magneticus TaxID=1609969 RepID=A0A0F0CJY8_9BACT|nr:membrane protein [Candidatus Omnitrophus magneticus]
MTLFIFLLFPRKAGWKYIVISASLFVIPASLFVIPAKAGIHGSCARFLKECYSLFWIPACAGMTLFIFLLFPRKAGWKYIVISASLFVIPASLFVIPAKAGIHGSCARFLKECYSLFWIPACAGMTEFFLSFPRKRESMRVV